MKPADLLRTDAADANRAVNMLVRAVELAWRSGAFACFFVLVTSTPEVPNLDGKLGLLTAFGVFCFLPRLEVSSIALAVFVMASLIASDTEDGNLATVISNDLSVDLTLAWIGIGLIVCAAVLRTVASTPDRGLTDRDAATLMLGWGAACQVLVFADRAVSGRWASLDPNSTDAMAKPIVHGEGAAFLIAAGWMVVAGMLCLTIYSGWRAKRSRTPVAMLAHPQTGAAASAVGFMVLGNSAASFFGGHPGEYQWIGAAAGVLVGLVVWLGFYLLTSNQHLRTWGAVRALVLGSCLVVMAAGLGVSAANVDGAGAVASLFLLVFIGPLGWDTWRRIGWTQRTVSRGYERAQAIERWLSEGQKQPRDRGRGLSQEELQGAREDLRRIRAVHAAASGKDFEAVVEAGEPSWRQDNVPPLSWLRQAAVAGRWQAFWEVQFQHDGAVKELKLALKELEVLRAGDQDRAAPKQAPAPTAQPAPQPD
jgi:hypothetical protein